VKTSGSKIPEKRRKLKRRGALLTHKGKQMGRGRKRREKRASRNNVRLKINTGNNLDP